MGKSELATQLLIAGLAAGVMLTFLMWIVRVYYPRCVGNVSGWIASNVMFGAASLFVSGLLPLSETPAIFMGQATFLGGLALVRFSVGGFARLRPAPRHLLAQLIMLLLALAGFSFIPDSQKLRTIVTMLAAGVLAWSSVRALLYLRHKSFPEWFTIAVLATVAALSVLHIGLVSANFAAASHIYFLTLGLCMTALMAGFFLVASKRLRNTLLSSSAGLDADGIEQEERWALAVELSGAIERNELVLHYQPRVSTRCGRVIAVEALVRWQHPVRGMVAPDRFISVAEETGYIGPLGAWVLKQGVACAASLAPHFPGVRVAINVSPKQLASRRFVALVRDTLEAAGLEGDAIELELTEGVAMDNPELAQATLLQLRELGVQLSIDDFGTGYSSLSYLKRLPVQCVKIDRSFIRDIPEQADARALVEAIVGVGQALELNIVAEGVENAAQLALLQKLGVDEYQGYLFSRPLPQAELTELLRDADALRIARNPLSPPSKRGDTIFLACAIIRMIRITQPADHRMQGTE
jgi:EAL domain-containing protein (putative c-di-GMP-specific phosphodiesterase class I)